MIIVGISSCKKEPETLQPSVEPLVSYLASVKAMNDVFLTFNYYYPEDFTSPEHGDGVHVTVDPVYPLDSFPKIIHIDFGTDGVLCSDSIVRKGSISCWVNAPWETCPSRVKVSFNDFKSDDIRVDGHLEVETAMLNDSILYTLSVLNGKLLMSNNDSVKFNCIIPLKTPMADYDKSLNPFSWDALTSQEFSGTDNKQVPFNVNIERILRYSSECVDGEVVSGQIRVTPDGQSDYKADFGNGACDGNLTISSGGIDFDLPF